MKTLNHRAGFWAGEMGRAGFYAYDAGNIVNVCLFVCIAVPVELS